MCQITLLDKISFILVLTASIALGFKGLFNINFLSMIIGNSDILTRIVYITVFVAALDLIAVLIKCKSLVSLK